MRWTYTIFPWIISICFMLCVIGSARVQADDLALLEVQESSSSNAHSVPMIRFRGLEVSSLTLFHDLEPKGTSQNFAEAQEESIDIDVMAGWEVFYKGLVAGYFGFGYGSQDYEDDLIEDKNSFHIAAGIDWNMTKKATLNLGLRQSMITGNEVSQGMTSTQALLQFNYKFLHNLFYDAFIDFSISDFDSSARRDSALSAGSGLRYQLNPKFAVSGEDDFTAEDSSALGPDYDSHEFTMHLHKKF